MSGQDIIKYDELQILRDADPQDFYKVLGIDPSATLEQIKHAYRHLATLCHPDLNNNNEEYKDLFTKLGRAYDTLSNPTKREKYDLINKSMQNSPVEKEEEHDLAYYINLFTSAGGVINKVKNVVDNIVNKFTSGNKDQNIVAYNNFVLYLNSREQILSEFGEDLSQYRKLIEGGEEGLIPAKKLAIYKDEIDLHIQILRTNKSAYIEFYEYYNSYILPQVNQLGIKLEEVNEYLDPENITKHSKSDFYFLKLKLEKKIQATNANRLVSISKLKTKLESRGFDYKEYLSLRGLSTDSLTETDTIIINDTIDLLDELAEKLPGNISVAAYLTAREKDIKTVTYEELESMLIALKKYQSTEESKIITSKEAPNIDPFTDSIVEPQSSQHFNTEDFDKIFRNDLKL